MRAAARRIVHSCVCVVGFFLICGSSGAAILIVLGGLAHLTCSQIDRFWERTGGNFKKIVWAERCVVGRDCRGGRGSTLWL